MPEDIKDLIDWNSQEMSPTIRDKLEQAFQDPARIEQGTARAERPAGVYDPVGEPEGTINDPNNFHKGYHSSSIIIAKELGSYLWKTYPGWAWVIQVNEFGHMIEIMNHHLHPSYGYRIRMEDIMNDPSRRCIKQGAGEILERFGMARRGLSGENLANLAHALRDAAGNCIPEISDLPDKKAATQAEIAKKVANGDIQVYTVNGQQFARIKK